MDNKVRDREQEHRDLCEKIHKTYVEKNRKYGNSFDISIDKYGLISALVRISDKFNRMEQLILTKDHCEGTDESLKDTCMDMSNYCLMLTMYLEANENNKYDETENE